MGKVVAGMTMSLDGFINDKKGSVDKLYDDFDELHDAPSFQEMIKNTGAVVMGRHVYEMQDPFVWINEDYEFQVPLFIVTHNPPEKYPRGNENLTLTFVTDGPESAIAQAKKVAGDKMVQVIGGANTIQQCLNEGLCDELQIDVMPALIGEGTRLFEHIDTDNIQLRCVKSESVTAMRTSITYTVTKKSQIE